MILLLLGGCVRGEAAPVPSRTAAPRCWVYCVVLLHAFTQPLLYTVTNLKYGVYRHLLC